MTTGLDRLRDLRKRGLLEKAYDQVAPALAQEEPGGGRADTAAAGRLLAAVDPEAVRAHHPATPVVTVAVTGQSTVGQVLDPLRGELARHGLLLRAVLGEHGTYLRDLTDTGSELHTAAPDLTLCLLDAETVFEQVPGVWRPEDVESAAADALERCAVLAAQAPGTLVVNTLPLPLEYSRRLIDHRSRARLGAVWREFNAALLRLTERFPGLVVIDLDPLTGEGGPVTDPCLARYAKVRLGAGLLAGYAREVAHLARALRGATRKCLVLDLDQTLWDGILAEDGPDGIAAAGTLRGEAFGAFQTCVRHLGSQGVLLAVSSKNDAADVARVLADHPDPVLRERDFVAVHANWEPKDGNLADIARGLDLSTDALVFADDSPAEREQVRHGLPGVAVVPLGEEPATHIGRLLADGWFDTLSLTDEDRARTGEYRARRERRELHAGAGSHEEYLRALELRLDVGPPRPHEAARISQLTLRTNQFNLAGGGLTEAAVTALAADAGRELLVARTADRFGDNGLVGAVLIGRSPGEWRLDNLWLSCRVLGRGVERAFVAVLLKRARRLGLHAVGARYVPTARNGRAGDLYPSCGFVARRPSGPGESGGGAAEYRHDLTVLPGVPDHIRVTESGKASR
ncbi:HAD-IIIC family phosphatase [Streptomyces sp. OfavH-34-F]|uniref:HAD-IIIC family phosphatase n=1 Tax=Streptomyces sp. OfavH-34-F TaxID=2917760 RepID=UPI001EF22B4D|nr:HAD-IIIC family phosphatase [Streptomyces sp. OfavH-34-F]MCG7524510.1 HAD-IIIC family phosphatase [Streptomyces sp. OfavH-34-F]